MLGQHCWDMLRCDVVAVWPGFYITEASRPNERNKVCAEKTKGRYPPKAYLRRDLLHTAENG